jgi:hypothetical protein
LVCARQSIGSNADIASKKVRVRLDGREARSSIIFSP